jgi:hypothetical protein
MQRKCKKLKCDAYDDYNADRLKEGTLEQRPLSTQPQGLAVNLFLKHNRVHQANKEARLFASLHDVYDMNDQGYQRNDKRHRLSLILVSPSFGV